MYSLDQLTTREAMPGKGLVVGARGATGVGKSVFAGGAPDPVLYVALDPNAGSVGIHARQPNGEKSRIQYLHLGIKSLDPTYEQQKELVEKFTWAWNQFLLGVNSEWGEPFKSFVVDTQSLLWEYIGTFKVEQNLRESKNPGRDVNRLDWGRPNKWMASLSTSRLEMRPDGNLIVLMHEGPVFVQDPDRPGQWKEHPTRTKAEGWKHMANHCQLYFHMLRGDVRNAKGQVVQKNGRYALLEKDTFDEQEVTIRQDEPFVNLSWKDVEELRP